MIGFEKPSWWVKDEDPTDALYDANGALVGHNHPEAWKLLPKSCPSCQQWLAERTRRIDETGE